MILKIESARFEHIKYSMELNAVIKVGYEKCIKTLIIPQIQEFEIENFWYWENTQDFERGKMTKTSKCVKIKYDNRMETHYFESVEKCEAFVEELEKCIKEVWSNPNMFIRKF